MTAGRRGLAGALLIGFTWVGAGRALGSDAVSTHAQIGSLAQTAAGMLGEPGGGAFGADVRWGIGYRLRERVRLWADAGLLILTDRGSATAGLGLIAIGQLFAYRGEHLGLFLEGGVGGYAFTRAFPEGGTPLNLTRQAGLGVTVPLRPGRELTVGVRQVHVSNQNALGRERNPGFDSLTVYLAGDFR